MSSVLTPTPVSRFSVAKSVARVLHSSKKRPYNGIMLVAIRLDEDIVAEIRERAREEGKTNSEIIRSLLRIATPSATPVATPFLPPATPNATPNATQPATLQINEDGFVDFDLHNQCCIDFIKSECRKICPHWEPRTKPWGELYFINNITHKLSNEYDEDGTWNPY